MWDWVSEENNKTIEDKHLKQSLENNVMWKYFISTCWQIEEMYNTNLKC